MYTFIVSLLITMGSVIFWGDFIKKNSKNIYVFSVFLALVTCFIGYNSKNLGIVKESFISDILVYFTKGFIPTAIFVVVMFTGALNNKFEITKKLIKIRGELSIIASILIFSHIGLYLLKFFQNFLPKLFSGKEIAFKSFVINISGIIAFQIMIPLFVTSFIWIRKKMNGKRWKTLQNFSYIFYLLIYIHIAFCTVEKDGIDYLKLSLYSLIFLTYTIMRIQKAKNKKTSNFSIA